MGGFPIWTSPSFLVLLCPFPGLSGFFSRIFPILSWDCLGIFPICSFPLSLGLLTAPTRNSPERVRDTIWTFPEKKWETPPVWKPSGLPSLKFIFRQEKTTFGRDGARDKQEPSLGQTGPFPGTNREPSQGQTGHFLLSSAVNRHFIPFVCPARTVRKMLTCVLCLLVLFFAPYFGRRNVEIASH